jgi:hypothetical protein
MPEPLALLRSDRTQADHPSNICCFLYPAYASYKALSTSPANTPEADVLVERWLMYWAVVGTWTAVEAVVGWTFTWYGWPFGRCFASLRRGFGLGYQGFSASAQG